MLGLHEGRPEALSSTHCCRPLAIITLCYAISFFGYTDPPSSDLSSASSVFRYFVFNKNFKHTHRLSSTLNSLSIMGIVEKVPYKPICFVLTYQLTITM